MSPEKNKEELPLLKNVFKIIINRVVSKSKYKRLIVHDIDNRINEIFACYEEYKIIIEKWMKKKNDKDGLDRHKMAAAFFCSVFKVKPISFLKNIMPKTPETLYEKQANELCAYLFGLQVVQMVINKKAKEENLSDDDKIIYGKPIASPKVHNSTYTEWFIKLVEGMDYYFDHKKKSFNEKLIFIVSHIYFMIESFSYQFHLAELNKSKIDKKQS